MGGKKSPTTVPELGAVAENAGQAEATLPGMETESTVGASAENSTTAAAPTATDTTVTPEVSVEETDGEKLQKALKRLGLINEARDVLRDFQLEVASAEQAKKEAVADLNAAIGRRDKAVIELERIIDDDRNGQGRLPFNAAPASPAPVVDPGEAAPASVLNTASILALVGQDEWEAAKNREEPIGMTPSHMDKLEASEIRTIGQLEKLMREDRYWRQTIKLGEKGEQRLIETLRVWRAKNPVPEAADKPQTILEKLADQTATANEETATSAGDGITPLPSLDQVVPEGAATESTSAA